MKPLYKFLFIIFIFSSLVYAGTLLLYKKALPQPIAKEEVLEYKLVPVGDEIMFVSDIYKFKFIYPKGWYMGDDRLINGSLQFYNFDFQKAQQESMFPSYEKRIKIEGGIGESSQYGRSEEYPELSREEKVISIAGQKTYRTDIVHIDNSTLRSYAVSLPLPEGKFLGFTVYGSSTDIYPYLDKLVKSITWIQ